MSDDFKSTIVRANRELGVKERIALKDINDAVKLDKAASGEGVLIYPVLWAEIAIHNPKSENPDYTSYVIVDKEGLKFTTSSPSFWRSFTDIVEEIEDSEDQTIEWGIRVFKKQSKNFAGDFITCSII